jgi:hypothetical protein
MTQKKSKSYIIVGEQGDPCPSCGRPTQIREHTGITERQLRQQCYYSRWFVCKNPYCKTTRILPERYIVWNARASAWDV